MNMLYRKAATDLSLKAINLNYYFTKFYSLFLEEILCAKLSTRDTKRNVTIVPSIRS